MYSVATILARALMAIFIALISLSISSINWMMKSINLCFQYLSRWVFVIKKLISKPWITESFGKISLDNRRNFYLHRLPAHDYELFCALHQESSEFFAQNLFDFVSLLDLDAHAHWVDRWLDENLLIFIATNSDWIEEKFLAHSTPTVWFQRT